MWILWLLLLAASPPDVSAACNGTFSSPVPDPALLDDGRLLDVLRNVTYEPGDFWSNGSAFFGCPCDRRACVFKCCPLGEEMDLEQEEGYCVRAGNPPIPSRLFLLHHDPCPGHKFRLGPEEYLVTQTGELVYTDDNSSVEAFGFCVDREPGGAIVAMVCFPEDDYYDAGGARSVMFVVNGVFMVVSVPFLVATFAVYAMSQRLYGNLHGKCLMSHLVALIVAYCFLAHSNFVDPMPSGQCYSHAFIIYFSFLASFFWLNVMCLDIFWTFSGFRSLRGTVREREFKKFIIYSIYSWGCPLIMLTICLVMHFHEGIPNDYVKPGFGQSSCWFKDTTSALAYFYGPVAVLILCNIILFILTAVKIAKLKREAEMFNNSESRRHDDEDNKQRFNLYLKLFLVMGVNWATEIISWAAGGPESIWYLTDIANTLQGVLIFIIFVWKDRIRKLLMERFCPKRAASATASKSTAVTYSTRGSSSVSSVKPGGKMNQESLRMTNMATSEESDVP